MSFSTLFIYDLLFLLAHFCACVLMFVLIQKPLFCAYNRKVGDKRFTPRTLAGIFWNGLYTDVKVAAYMTAPVLILLWINAHTSYDDTPWLVAIDIVMVVIVAVLCVADTVLYKYWQYKIEASVLAYLRSLKGAFASVSAAYVAMCILVVAVVACLFGVMLLIPLFLFKPTIQLHLSLSWWEYLVIGGFFIILAGTLFCIIRGFHRRPDTPVYSYFCNIPFFNHCAVNPVYNFIYSLSINDDFAHQFQEYDPDYCHEKLGGLFPTGGKPLVGLLKTNRPNILVIVWESLCAHFIESLGGVKGVMPQFDRLSKEGVFFTNCWAGSFRTDRGLVCILSGYLGQPTTSIILHTSKLPHLPALPRTLRDVVGYKTMAVHGGELNIFHKSDYYWASGHDRLVEQKDFPSMAPKGKWGVHDGYVFKWLADDIVKKAKSKTLWFTTFQTLSSHEPFKVPYDRIRENSVDNSFAYTDEAFGHFIDYLKKTTAWEDLLIVVTGDHGIDMNVVPDQDRNSHIPLLLLGGALVQPMQIDTFVSQTDIAATLLGQMGLPHDDFIFSRDVLADTYRYPFAFHTYNNGFIFRDATGVTNYDNLSQTAVEGGDTKREETAKIILQTLYTDLSKR